MDSRTNTKAHKGRLNRGVAIHTWSYKAHKMATKMAWQCVFGRRQKVPKYCVNNYWCQTYQAINKKYKKNLPLAECLLKSLDLNPCEFYLNTILQQPDKKEKSK